MILTNRKYVDPSPLLNTLVDKEGKPIHKGAQEDPTEFSITFLERIKDSVIKLISTKESEELTEEKIEEVTLSDQLNKLSVNNREEEDVDTPFVMDDEDEPEPANEKAESDNNEKNENDENKNENSESQKKEEDKKPEARTFIDDLFSGKFIQRIISKEEDGTDVKLVSDFSFMQLILTLTNSQHIYESLDTYTYMKIDEFTTPKSNISHFSSFFSIFTSTSFVTSLSGRLILILCKFLLK